MPSFNCLVGVFRLVTVNGFEPYKRVKWCHMSLYILKSQCVYRIQRKWRAKGFFLCWLRFHNQIWPVRSVDRCFACFIVFYQRPFLLFLDFFSIYAPLEGACIPIICCCCFFVVFALLFFSFFFFFSFTTGRINTALKLMW